MQSSKRQDVTISPTDESHVTGAVYATDTSRFLGREECDEWMLAAESNLPLDAINRVRELDIDPSAFDHNEQVACVAFDTVTNEIESVWVKSS